MAFSNGPVRERLVRPPILIQVEYRSLIVFSYELAVQRGQRFRLAARTVPMVPVGFIPVGQRRAEPAPGGFQALSGCRAF
jgi:hypothetical protein